MISYHDASRHNNFCKCTHSSSVFTEMDEWGYCVSAAPTCPEKAELN